MELYVKVSAAFSGRLPNNIEINKKQCTNRLNHLVCSVALVAGSVGFFYGVFMQIFICFCRKFINGTVFFDRCNNVITPVVQLEQFKL